MSRPIYTILLGLLITAPFPALVALPAATAAAAPAPPAPPLQPAEIAIGTELVARNDVVLRSANLTKGTRVRVVKVSVKNGKPTALSLELPDGHVIRAVSIR